MLFLLLTAAAVAVLSIIDDIVLIHKVGGASSVSKLRAALDGASDLDVTKLKVIDRSIDDGHRSYM